MERNKWNEINGTKEIFLFYFLHIFKQGNERMITEFFSKKVVGKNSLTNKKTKRMMNKRKSSPKEDGSSSSNVSKVKKIKHEKHVLTRPENYIGSVKQSTRTEYVGQFVDEKIVLTPRELVTVPGLFSVVDEIVTNATDHFRRSLGSTFPVKNLKITVDATTGSVSVYNDGNGIVVEKLKQDDGTMEWGPSLCMGHLLTSENYNDQEKRLVGGRNGFGAALCNIWSTEFAVETLWIDERDGSSHLFNQKWRSNMTVQGICSIKHPKRKSGYTKVSFVLDFPRFGLGAGFFPVLEGMLCRRACDMAAATPGLNVYFQNTKLNLKHYVDVSSQFPPLYSYAAMLGGTRLTYVELGDRWQCVVFAKEEDFPPVPSFVNGVRCDEGGDFVDVVEKELFSLIRKTVQQKMKVKLHKNDIQSCVGVIVVALLENPAFQTQTKDKCISTPSEFGSIPTWTLKDLTRAMKAVYPVIEEVARAKSIVKNKKMIGAIQGAKLTVPKYEGARKSGTKESRKCSLYLVEGDSAKTFVISGFGVIGREYNGVFPLKGKLINCRKFGINKVMQNKEIQNLMKIIGLQPGVRAIRNKLRYGRICIVTDQDVDGSHIKGLLLNFLHWRWPETLFWEGFVCVFHTPIIVVKWGRGNKREFYTKGQFNEWKTATSVRNWSAKYYKGLATSSVQEAKGYFRDVESRIVPFDHQSDKAAIDMYINVAFSDDTVHKAERKRMVLSQTGTNTMIEVVRDIPNFVLKELKAFWDDNNKRVLPSIIDGLKESQRKVIFALRKKNTRSEKSELRVSQIAAYTTEVTLYEHGETSLCGTIVGMAQTYVGSNNIPLLKDSGQFGTRCAVKDSGSPRYIHSYLTKYCDLIFPVENDAVLTYIQEGSETIEPYHYVGVVPFLLINGARGIGTGVITNIWPYNPLEVIRITRARMYGHAMGDIRPWYKGFTGTVEPSPNGFVASGVVIKHTTEHVTITELYPGKTTEVYVNFLRNQSFVNAVEVLGTEETVHLEVYGAFTDTGNALVKTLKLSTELRTTEMWAASRTEEATHLKQFKDIRGIVDLHHAAATEMYNKRRLHEIALLEQDIRTKKEKIYFIQGWVDGVIRAGTGSRAQVVEWMTGGGYASEDEFKRFRQLPNEQLFAEKIAALKVETEKTNAELRSMQETTGLKMWEKELTEFETYYVENNA